MSISYKILGQGYIGLTSYLVPNTGYGYYAYSGSGSTENESFEPVVLYQVPENKNAIVTSVFVSNHDTNPITYDVAVVPNGEVLAKKHHVRWDYPIVAGGFDILTMKISMSSGDRLMVFPSAADKVAFTAFGMEI